MKNVVVKKNLIWSLAILCILMCSGSILGQENCFNGIDDDGDGQIDIQDTDDCTCQASTFLIDKSFELQSCCPIDRNYSSSIDCLDEGWFTAGGSADYFHTCGWMGDAQSPFVPLPMPSGDGVMGIATFTETLGAPFPFYESIANCLDAPMTTGENHEISLHVGFGIDQGFNVSTLNITLGLYGKVDCNDLWMGGNDDCMTTYNDWELITPIPVSSPFVDNWVFVNQTFVPTKDYAAIGIAMVCGDYPIKMYHFLDDIKISGPGNDVPADLVSFGDCLQGVSVELLNPVNGNADFQWYLDGVAIAGANSNTHIIENAAAEGEYQVMITDNDRCSISNPINIIIDETILEIDGFVEDIQCNGELSGSIDLAINSNNTPVTFNWDFGGNTGFVDGLAEGAYEVTVTDAHGCIDIETFVIQEPEVLLIQSPSDEFVCNGASNGVLEPNVSGGFGDVEFLWSTGENTSSLTNVGAGVYTVTVTDQNLCTAEQTFIIQDLPELEIQTITFDEFICSGTLSALLEADVNGASGSVDYLWSTGENTSSLSNVGAGSYTVMVTDENLCTAEQTFIIQGLPELEIQTIAFDEFICSGTLSALLEADVNGASGSVDYLWSTGENTSSLTNVGAGSYTVTVTDENLCTAEQTFIIQELPELEIQTIAFDEFICSGTLSALLEADVNGASGSVDYLWSTGESTSSLTNVGAGAYTVTVTDQNLCTAEETFVIQENSEIIIEGTLVEPDCNGSNNGEIDLNISGGLSPYQILWPDGSSETSISQLSAGEYSVIVTDAENCTQEAQFLLSNAANFSVTPTVINASCASVLDGSIALDVTGAAMPTFLWEDGSTQSTLSGLAPGVYTVVVSDGLACEKTFSYEVEANELFEFQSTHTELICTGTQEGIIELIPPNQEIYTYDWNNGNNDATQTNLAAGNYSVIITNDVGCQNTYDFEIGNSEPLAFDPAIVEPLCSDSADGNISVIVSGGEGNISLLWSTDETTNQISNLEEGTYSLIATDQLGCQHTESFQIESPQAMVVQEDIEHAGCDNEAIGSINLNISGGIEPYEIAWNTGASTALISDLTSGIYSVQILDGNGCSFEQDFEVLDNGTFEVQVVAQNISCFGASNGSIIIDEITGTAPYDIQLNGTAGALENFNLSVGSYVLEVTDLNGCIYTEQIVLESPDQLEVNSTVLPISCPNLNDAEIILEVSGGVEPYEIINQGNAFVATGLSPGVYNLIVQDANGCEMVVSETIEDIVLPALEYNISYPDCGETGELQILNIEEFSQELLITSENTSSVLTEVQSNLPAGIYLVELEYGTDCIVPIQTIEIEENESSTTPTVVQDVTINEGQNQILSIAESLPTQSEYMVVWQSEQEYDCVETDDLDNCISIDFLPLQTTSVNASLIYETGCEEVFQFNITLEKEYNVYVPNIISDYSNESFKLYAQSDLTRMESFLVYDRWGNRLYQEEDVMINEMKGWDLKFKDKKVAGGVYVYMAQFEHPSGKIESVAGDITVVR